MKRQRRFYNLNYHKLERNHPGTHGQSISTWLLAACLSHIASLVNADNIGAPDLSPPASEIANSPQASRLPEPRHNPAYVAIIIDDMGHNILRGEQAISLPGAVTFAVIPNARHASSVAQTAYKSRKEVIIHLPMANLTNHPLGKGGLTTTQTREDFIHNIAYAVEQVPHATGLNNHTGSYLTQQYQQMDWLMDELKKRELFFVDSRTTPQSIAKFVADQKNLPSARRDVFLDNDQSLYAIDKSFKKLIRLARQRGTAIAIGHPYPVTLEYLEMALPLLAKENIYLVPASTIIAMQKVQQMASEQSTLAGGS